MASYRRRGAVRLRNGFSKSETPRFVKLMFAQLLNRGRTLIPRKFMRMVGDNLSSSVLLKVPGGEPFKVRVEEAEGKVWLGKGWRRFEEHYHVMEGSLLMFELEGKDVLHVVMFDMTVTEIEYPTAKRSCNRQSMLSHEYLPSDDDDESPLCGLFSSRRSRRLQRLEPHADSSEYSLSAESESVWAFTGT